MHPHPATRLGRTTARLILGMLATAAVASGAGLAGDPKARAEEIVRAAGASGGLCVHLGCGDGRLTAELSSGGRFLGSAACTGRCGPSGTTRHGSPTRSIW